MYDYGANWQNQEMKLKIEALVTFRAVVIQTFFSSLKEFDPSTQLFGNKSCSILGMRLFIRHVGFTPLLSLVANSHGFYRKGDNSSLKNLNFPTQKIFVKHKVSVSVYK